MKMILKRTTTLLIVSITLCTLFCGCKSDDNNIPDTSTPETTASVTEPEKINLSEYSIVRAEDGSEGEKNAAVLLNQTFTNQFGVTVTIKTDWDNKNTEDDIAKKEILVGLTNYTVSQTNYEGLTRKGYRIAFEGNKIVIIGGSGEGCITAVEKFIADYMTKEGDMLTLKSTEPLNAPGDYKYAEATVKTVSLNLRTATNANVNMQSAREPLIASFIAAYKPDSLGVQECEIFWRMRLETVLTGYGLAQEVVANAGTKNYIFYNTDTLTVVDQGVFWLSETPDIRSKGFGSAFNISCCWAIFEYKATGTRYVHMNAHLDYSDENIRIKEIPVLIERMNKFIDEGYAVIITGDFNSKESSPIYKAMIAEGIKDSRYTAPVTSTMATFNNFDMTAEYTGPIDFCFTGPEISAQKFDVIDKWDRKFLSDHNALYTELTLYYRDIK